MNLDRFADLVTAYGADPVRWPGNERAAAQALAQASSEARRLLQEAASLDAVLMHAPAPEPSADLASRIMAQLPPVRVAQPRPVLKATLSDVLATLFPFRAAWPQFATFAIALSLGIGLGLGGLEEIFPEDSAPYAVQLVIADTSFLPE